MKETEKEIISPSGKYKAVVYKRVNHYELYIYLMEKDFESENGHWTRINTKPILVDKKFAPEFFAIEEIRALIGAPDLPLSIEWVRDYSFVEIARFLNPKGVKVFSESIDSESGKYNLIHLQAKTIIDFDGLCLVEEVGYEGDWQMGQLSDGEVVCWADYGSIEDAIKSL